MILTVGTKAVYPCQGPCRIDRVINRVVDGRLVLFYHLFVLSQGRGQAGNSEI